MANIRDIKRRIQSIKNTKQITNAMKMVATAKLRKSKDRILNARPYANQVNKILLDIKAHNRFIQSPVFQSVENPQKPLLIVATSDRGLCGSFNHNIIKKAVSMVYANKNLDLICIGKKGYDYLKKRTDRIIKHYLGIFNEMNFDISTEIGDYILDLFLNQGYDSIEILYNEFVSVIQQNVIHKKIFPVELPEEIENQNLIDFEYEPDEISIINEVLKKYVGIEIWRVMLESSAAEQGARMTAMDSATDNATELIGQLTLHYNRARQASITKEIIEISSGAEAIK
jgi:F-type H+-transporting ATPase subunit gamma